MALVDKEYMTSLFTLLADRVDTSKLYQYSIVYNIGTSTYCDAVCVSFYSTKDFDISSTDGRMALINYLIDRGAYIMASGVLWDMSSGDSNIFYVVTDCYMMHEIDDNVDHWYLCFRGYSRDITSSISTPAEKRINISDSNLSYLKSKYVVSTTNP